MQSILILPQPSIKRIKHIAYRYKLLWDLDIVSEKEILSLLLPLPISESHDCVRAVKADELVADTQVHRAFALP